MGVVANALMTRLPTTAEQTVLVSTSGTSSIIPPFNANNALKIHHPTPNNLNVYAIKDIKSIRQQADAK